MALPIGPENNSNKVWGTGTCDRCGDEDVDLYCICDDEKVCGSCLDSYFFQCEECGQHWDLDVMETRDDRQLCPDCADDYDSEHDEESDEEEGT